MTDIYDIAVAGAGFSGLMVIANIMRREGPKPRIFWTDPESGWGFGLAYSTYEPCHLLNVRADRMGAWADGIDDFWRWLQKHYPGEFKPDDFVPRMIYGQYLLEIRERFSHLPLEEAAVTSAKRSEGRWQIRAGDRTIIADQLVLATGNPPIASLHWPESDIYVDNFWRWRLEGGSGQFLPAGGTVVVAGAGLTAADAMLALFEDGYKGKILCVSPHGHMPEKHASISPYGRVEELASALYAHPSARRYLHILREHAHADNWRDVVESLRPHLVRLWQALEEEEKGRFMRHLWSRWNIHRHRMSPSIGERLRESGQVTLMAGRLIETAEDGTIRIRPRDGGETLEVKAVKVLNCTGPSYRKMLDQNPLLAYLNKKKLIEPGPLSLGMAKPETPGLYAIGTLLLGENLETTAVPELRVQAAALAAALRG